MRKQNPSWEFTLNHQHYFNNKIVDASIGIQRSLPWLSSTATPEEQAGLYSPLSRIVHGNLQAMMKFDATGDKFTWLPASAPSSARTNSLPIINSILVVAGACAVLTVKTACPAIRDGTGATILSGIWPPTSGNLFGRGYRPSYRRRSISKGKVLSGAVSGLRGQLWSTQYDLFISTPLSKPDKFHSDALNMGFSLQWRY